jgi:hypothetical protein
MTVGGPGFPSVYFQRYDSSGNRIGSAEIVNEVFRRAEHPDIAVNKDGSFVICWQDDRHTPVVPVRYDIFMQRYNSNGVKIGNNVKVNDDNDSTKDQLAPSISSDGRGQIVISWGDQRLFYPFSARFYQLYDSNGTIVGPNKRADVNATFAETGMSRVFMRSDRKFFIGWTDESYAGRAQFYGRRFDSLGNPIGNPYMIPMSSPGTSTQRGDAVAIYGDRVYSTWTDNRNGGSVNYDIYCNVRGFQNPDTVIGIINTNTLAEEFKLFPAYPNPFNTKSKIKYQISKKSNVKLIVYNVLGEEVGILVDEHQLPGTYEAAFDGTDFPSGVYFYRLIAGDNIIAAKKLIIVK